MTTSVSAIVIYFKVEGQWYSEIQYLSDRHITNNKALFRNVVFYPFTQGHHFTIHKNVLVLE